MDETCKGKGRIRDDGQQWVCSWDVIASVLEGSNPLQSKKALHSYRADLLQEPEKKTDTTASDVGKRLFAGGIAGAIAKTAIAPLDRVKIIFQTHPAKLFSLRNVVLELVRGPLHAQSLSPAASCNQAASKEDR